MTEFAIGTTVRITGPIMKGLVGTVVHHDETRGMYLVNVGSAQNYYVPEEIEVFAP